MRSGTLALSGARAALLSLSELHPQLKVQLAMGNEFRRTPDPSEKLSTDGGAGAGPRSLCFSDRSGAPGVSVAEGCLTSEWPLASKSPLGG